VRCFLRLLLFIGDFRSKLNSTAHDAEARDRYRDLLKICTREGFANVRCEGAKFLDLSLSSEVEVVIPIAFC
jgi:hypothetical protein